MPTQVSLTDGALVSAGTLAIKTNGSTNAITIDATQVATIVNNPILSGLTASSPVFTDASKALTSTGTVGVAKGGTGLSTTTAYGLIAAGTTSTGNFQQVSGTGTSGQVLTSNGAGALPTWQTASSGGGTSVGTVRAIAINCILP